MRRRLVAAVAALVATLATVQVVGVIWHTVTHDGDAAGAGLAAVPALLRDRDPAARDVAAYEGAGAWVDLYDTEAGSETPVTPAAVDDMAAAGVRTLYLQVARDDGAAEPGLHDPVLAGRFLVQAHERGMRVVGWFVPRFGDVDRDLAHLEAIAEFEVLGHRFDGVAVDIEWTETVADDATRSDRLVALSEALRESVGSDALGAIVMPPVHLDVVNPGFWPGFPWERLAPLYDAWLPMGYWTDRTAASGWRDAATYTRENLRRLGELVGGDTPVHAIGGLGAESTAEDLAGFVAAVEAQGEAVIGASIYDWATLAVDARRHLSDSLRP
jgi:hypothetical protein